MRNKIFGGIGILWGGAILLRGLLVGTSGSGSYQSGQWAGVAIGALFLIAGLYTFFKD